MDIGTFSTKLRQLNESLYVDLNHRTHATGSKEGTSGIYLRGRRGEEVKSPGLGLVEVLGAEKENSAPDLYVGWTQHGYVPEGDLFDLDTGKVLAQGWRTIVKRLIRSNHTTARKAWKVFGYNESFYDRMNYDQRLTFHRKGNECLLPQL